MLVIGIDIGTGSTKAVAVDASGTVVDSSQVYYPTINPEPDFLEQDPEEVYNAFVESVRQLSSRLSSPYCIALSSAMHSLIPVTANGTPLSNMITWADRRSAEVAARLRLHPLGRTIYEETGTPIHPMSPLCKIIWMQENRPELVARTHKFISIKEYMWFKLFSAFEVDYSIASATGLFNIHTLGWHESALKLAGITALALSHPVNTTSMRKGISQELATRLGVPSNTLFMIGASDGCLANVGSYATEPGIAALTIGTSGAIRVTAEKPSLNWAQMTFNYRLTEKQFVCGGPINNGGIALKWYAQNLLKQPLQSKADYDQLLSALDEIPPGANGLIFLPYLLGERAPIWNSNACGAFFGITAEHRQEHFTKAVIEGILFSLYQIMRGIEYNGTAIRQIHVSGGFVNSREWVQLLATISGKKVILVNRDDASAIGAAYLCFETMGDVRYRQRDETDDTSFIPDPSAHEKYRSLIFPLYEELYPSLAKTMELSQAIRKSSL